MLQMQAAKVTPNSCGISPENSHMLPSWTFGWILWPNFGIRQTLARLYSSRIRLWRDIDGRPGCSWFWCCVLTHKAFFGVMLICASIDSRFSDLHISLHADFRDTKLPEFFFTYTVEMD